MENTGPEPQRAPSRNEREGACFASANFHILLFAS